MSFRSLFIKNEILLGYNPKVINPKCMYILINILNLQIL